MAKAEDPRRNYNMTDADLCMFTSNLVNDLTLDLPELAPFGVTAPNILALKALGDAFEILPTDIEIEAAVMEATLAKNALIAQVKDGIRNLALRVELKWGIDSIKYKTLKITGMNNVSDTELIFVARRVLRMMTSYLPDLAAEGLTQLMLDDFSSLIDDFEEAKNLQHDKMDVRADASMVRLTAGNTLYAQVVKYCEIGKRVFVNTNIVRYNCYVIYDTSIPGTLTAPTNLQYDQVSGLISWDAVENATSYKAEISFEGAAFEEIYADVATETYYIPPSTPSNFIIQVMARNSGGLGPVSPLTVFYDPPLQAPGYISISITNPTLHTIGINWGDSVGATGYRLYHSAVPLGAPQGEFSLVGEYAGTSYMGTVAATSRHYYYVVAYKGSETSAPSDVSYVDML